MYRKFLFSLLFFSASSSGAILGLVTGNDYLELNKESRSAWSTGVIDGILAQSFKSKSSDFDILSSCLKRYELKQLLAIFEKDLRNEPESWHAPAALILKSSIEKTCSNEKTL